MNIVKHFRSLKSERLTTQQWAQRHRIVLSSLFLPGLAIAWLCLFEPQPIDIISIYTLIIVVQAMLALLVRISPSVRQLFGVGALFTATAVLVQISGGSVPAHLLFAVMLCVLTLYQDWITYFAGVILLALYYVGLGQVGTQIVTASGVAEQAPTVGSWTFLLTALGTSLISVAGWVLSARSVRESETMKRALAEAGLRDRQARELNDTVVQHLTTAVYAGEDGDLAGSITASRQALLAASRLVSSLHAPAWLHDPMLLRDNPSQPSDNTDNIA